MGSILDITYKDMQNATPSNTVDVPGGFAAGFGSDDGGTMTVITMRGTTVQRTTVAGVIYPVAIKRVMLTGTAATKPFVVYGRPFGPIGGDRA